MQLTYNGVKLSICHFNTYAQRAVGSEDGADYLMMHTTIDVTCVWNANATASFNEQPMNPPAGQAGDGPALSIATLRDKLMQKRQLLVVDIGGRVILDAPSPILPGGVGPPITAPVDANNGPNPLDFNVISFQGVTTAIVRFKIECWINENQYPQSVIISNRWGQTEDIDQSFRSTLHVEGTVVFRPDLLFFDGHRADAFRQRFILPVPLGYQRHNVRVRAGSDGLRINYSFDDEQAEGNYQMLPSSAIVRVRGRTWYQCDWLGLDGRLPTMNIGAEVEVWGRNSATRTQLAQAVVLALSSVPGTLGAAIQNGIKPTLDQHLSVDFPTRHANGSVVFALNGLIGSGIIIAGGADPLNVVQLAPLFTDFSAENLWVQGAAPQVNVASPGGGTRSEALIALVTQALLTPGAAPTNITGDLRVF